MAGTELGAALRQIHHLFAEGSVAGLSYSQLLERFLARRDEVAFAVLVDRHGPLVLATCRALVRDPDDAEDAFQATFLVLVKKAGSIRDRDARWSPGFIASRAGSPSRPMSTTSGGGGRNSKPAP